jgi:hypothetical protein
LQPVCNNGGRPGRRATLGAVVLVWLHLLLPWIHHAQHAGCRHGGHAPAAAARACTCGHEHAGAGLAHAPDCDPAAHDATHCVVCQQLRSGNPLLGAAAAAPPLVAPVVPATAVLAPPAPPRAVPVACAPPRGPPLPV